MAGRFEVVSEVSIAIVVEEARCVDRCTWSTADKDGGLEAAVAFRSGLEP